MQKVALITGASSGIGKELARIHASKGGDLIIVARSESKLIELKKELEKKYSRTIKVITKDLSTPNAAQEIFDEVQATGIQVEVLINNAGFGGRGKFHEREWAEDLSMIQVNVLALTALTRFFLPGMVKRNQGKILNISSTASLLPGPLQAVYYATKAFVTSFSNALAEELHDSKVSVTALLPGATETGFASTSGMDKTSLFNKPFPASKVAEAGYKAMEQGKLNKIAGVSFGQRVMFAFMPLMPKKMVLKQIRKMQEVK